ncbi:hypothetical protein GCM10023259_069860 [Thermocatellispora tengchongensis]
MPNRNAVAVSAFGVIDVREASTRTSLHAIGSTNSTVHQASRGLHTARTSASEYVVMTASMMKPDGSPWEPSHLGKLS